MGEKKVSIKFPISVEEENEMMVESVLQLITVMWAKLTRKVLVRRETTNVDRST